MKSVTQALGINLSWKHISSIVLARSLAMKAVHHDNCPNRARGLIKTKLYLTMIMMGWSAQNVATKSAEQVNGPLLSWNIKLFR